MAETSRQHADDRDAGDDTIVGDRGSSGFLRLAMGGALVGVVAGFCAIVWYAYDSYTRSVAGNAPLIVADPSPVRVAPEDPGGLQVDHQDRLVLQGEQPPLTVPDDAVDEVLQPAPERPLPRPAPEEGASLALADAAPELPAGLAPLASADLPAFAGNPATALIEPSAARPLGSSDGAGPAAADPTPTATGVSVTLPDRPEALIERRDEDLRPLLSLDPLGNQADPRFHRMVNLIPLTDQDAPAPDVEVAALPADPDEPAVLSEEPSASRVARIMELAATLPNDPDALTRALEAVDGASDTAAEPVAEDQTAVSEEPASQAAADASDYRRDSGTYRVQLAAVRQDGVAREEWRRLNRLHGDLLGGLDLHVESIEVNGRTYHRIQAGPVDPSSARSLCDALRDRGADCLVRP